MDFTVIQNAATKIVDNFKSVGHDITDLKDRATDLEQEVAVLDSRMDVFTALPEGATTNDAALEDVKVGYDGTVYEGGPGEAVREQISQLHSEIAYQMPNYETNMIQGVFIRPNGKEEELANFECSDYIEVVGKSITLCCSNYLGEGYAFFDKNKICISGGQNEFLARDGYTDLYITEIEIPQNAYYFRYSNYNKIGESYCKPQYALNQIFENRLMSEKNANDIELLKGGNFGTIKGSISMFSTIGVCGDSFTKGAIYVGDTLVGYPESSSWGKVLERKSGVDVSIYADGGVTCNTWNTSNGCLPKLLNDTPKDCYIVFLGINDAYQNKAKGSIADVTEDYTNNPDTIYGNLGKVVGNIKNHAPNSCIILGKSLLMTYGGIDYYNYTSTIIEEVANKLGIPFIDTKNSAFLTSDEYGNNIIRNHPTAPLYSGIAVAVDDLVSKALIDYIDYFQEWYPR